ncbi:MAG TPA: N-acetylmuramoyl-L-alanine amidase [Thermopetrobacter sp.]|nr:N-acetylmuramoyl-L-alanine amidase [Thermopetrobacter sp.]
MGFAAPPAEGAPPDRRIKAKRGGAIADMTRMMAAPRRHRPGPGWILLAGWLCALLLMAAPATAGSDSRPVPVAAAMHVAETGHRAVFTAELDRAAPFNVYVLADPWRVMIDLPEVRFRLRRRAAPGRIVREVRYGRIEPGKARIVIETRRPVLIGQSRITRARPGRPARLLLELNVTDAATFRRLQARATRRQAAAHKNPDTLSLITRAYRRLIDMAAPGAAKRPPRTISDLLNGEPMGFKDHSANPGAATAAKDTIAPPLPAASRRPLIVIDPGHGGKDPGAIGWRGMREKKVVLLFARALRDALSRGGRYRVRLTRDSDRFLSLAQRVAIARAAGADLFVSIHADKFRSAVARGMSVYTLSEEASDEEAAELARKENAADVIDGIDLGAANEEVRDILIDLALRETSNRSVFFARSLMGRVKSVTRVRKKAVRSADFRVLRNPEVPAVLVELGYISNRVDARNMLSAAWRAKVSKAMARAIESYFANHLAWRR